MILGAARMNSVDQATLKHFVNARLIDPASGYDGPGELVVADGLIAFMGQAAPPSLTSGASVIDCDGNALLPGLIDMRVSTGEPGQEHRETLKSAGRAAVSGGITTIVVQPDTNPVIGDAAMVDFITRRGRDRSLARVLAAGALTQNLAGERMAEIGLMSEAGAVMFANGPSAVSSTRVMQRCLSYSAAYDALVATRPEDPWLAEGGVMNLGELASRLGLAGIPHAAETIIAERDIQLVALTGGKLLLDMISCAGTVKRVAAAKAQGLDVSASVSVHHLTLNEVDVGDYRTFAKLSPPLRREEDRLALVEAVREGLIDVIVSGHDPRPAEEKRLPFDEAAFGASALETLLCAALTLYHEGQIELLDLFRPLTIGPATLLNLPQGRLSPGAPGDVIVVDLGYPLKFAIEDMVSKSKNSPFDGRRLQGKVLGTWVGGMCVYNVTQGQAWFFEPGKSSLKPSETGALAPGRPQDRF
jgi:dihydroorotase